jgi:hypothetical protein
MGISPHLHGCFSTKCGGGKVEKEAADRLLIALFCDGVRGYGARRR